MTRTYVKLEEMDLDVQVDRLIKAVRQLQSRLDDHAHVDGRVMVSTLIDETVDMNGDHIDVEDC